MKKQTIKLLTCLIIAPIILSMTFLWLELPLWLVLLPIILMTCIWSVSLLLVFWLSQVERKHLSNEFKINNPNEQNPYKPFYIQFISKWNRKK